ncbi:TOM7 family-domain-containing protein [Myxozyma melibiosi]|uniref:TOM7 family-domain-containing protein n=1 Tax=Myxozyma melibiosi TaxID=54550 RepID=A0ABR1F6G6_9ASCO
MAFHLSEESKERILKFYDISQVAFRFGFVPLIIFLGWSQTYPRPSLIRLLSPLAMTRS